MKINLLYKGGMVSTCGELKNLRAQDQIVFETKYIFLWICLPDRCVLKSAASVETGGAPEIVLSPPPPNPIPLDDALDYGPTED